MRELEQEQARIKSVESFLRNDIEFLSREYVRVKDEIDTLCSVPLEVGTFVGMADDNYAIVQCSSGTNLLVRVKKTVERHNLKENCNVALNKESRGLVDILPPQGSTDFHIMVEKPDVTYADIGGMEVQKQELREAVELPLMEPALFQRIGVEPPRGVLLSGPTGPGKTMLAKAVAHHTKANFIAVNGSQFNQKYLGEGPRMVRDLFNTARENLPCIIFVDELDSVCTSRSDSSHSYDRENARVLHEFLSNMDGFDSKGEMGLMVIMATNRPEALDAAILRPGRLDRKIECPLPDRRTKRNIFSVCTKEMSVSPDFDIEDYVNRSDPISGADVRAICMEAGLAATRQSRFFVLPKDFEAAYEKVVRLRRMEIASYL